MPPLRGLYEIENGKEKITYKPTVKKPVKEYLKEQKRFKHLSKEIIDRIQENIDRRWKEIFGEGFVEKS